ncbi:MAG: diguanylate cyclase [Rhodoferax sp.]|uniref:sensor domain-containing diguanylate cyclase n=1 Tax=Rhodoferax sp. TaxID=50421 RepID=UPI002730CD17|nr:diguanylate cyclase [Rhodoferax sp.]MDP1529661.1 diguanylate cyclase [Rhodoferax sp.]MDP1945360.1 diguanylate cyclase [Rhodoferax sp.]
MSPHWKIRLPHLVAWSLAVVVVLALLLLTRQVTQAHLQESERSARRELANLSQLSQQHANRTLHAADQTLQIIRALYLRDGMALDLAALVREGAVDVDLLHQVGIIDAQGIFRLSNLPQTPAVNLADREYFKVHVARAGNELFVSQPMLGRVSNKWTIQLTRRISQPDGGFAGVAVVSLDAGYFASFYASLDLGQQGNAMLLGRDGRVLAQRDKLPTGGVIEMAFPQAPAEGFFDGDTVTMPRLYHFRQVSDFPLYVSVALGKQEYLQAGQQTNRLNWLLASLGSLLLLGFAAFFSWDRYLVQQQHQQLAQSHKQMTLALDSGGLALWTWDLVTGKMAMDDRLWAMLGVVPGERTLDNNLFAELLHPDDRPMLAERLPPVLRGEVPRLLLEHRLRHQDGHWVHLMARGQVVARDAAGRALRMMGTEVDRSEQKRLELAVQQSQALLRDLTDQVPAELFQFTVDTDGRMHFSYLSKHFLDFYGLTLEQVQRDASLVFAWQHPDDVARVKQSIQQAATHLTHWQTEYRLKLPDGTVRWRGGRAVPQKREDGSVVFHGAIFDITERIQAEEAQRVAAVAFESSASMVVSSADLRILRVNHAFVALTGYGFDEAVGQSSNILRSGRHDPVFYQAMWHSLTQTGHWEGEVWNRRKNGDMYPDWLSITAVKNPQGQVTHYVSMHTDVTLRKRFDEDIRKLAFFDPLTQLPNRRLLLDRLQQLSAMRARNNQVAAVLFLDLDRFKLLNDSYGHDQGDELLIQVAQRLQACVREIDTVARLGGDEFVVALAQLSDDADLAHAGAQAVANKILQAMAQPFVLPDVTWSLSASIGVALLVNDKALPEDLLKQADMAMYQAKAAGRNRVHFFSHRSRPDAG